MNKRELSIIADAVDSKNPKRELNFAYIDFDRMCIASTNTRKLVKYFLNTDEVERCSGVHYLHKKVLKLIISLCAKEIEYKFVKNHIVIDDVKISLNTNDIEEKFNYPNIDVILNKRFEDEYITDNIRFIDFDLTHRNTHINSDALKTLQEFGDAGKYKVESIAQTSKDIGMVKISGVKNNNVRFTAMIMGIDYKPQAPTLFD